VDGESGTSIMASAELWLANLRKADDELTPILVGNSMTKIIFWPRIHADKRGSDFVT
jgi:hypothetical protein